MYRYHPQRHEPQAPVTERRENALPPEKEEAVPPHTDDHVTPPPRPACIECGVAMWLKDIAPANPYHEKRTYTCPSCDALQSTVVRYDE